MRSPSYEDADAEERSFDSYKRAIAKWQTAVCPTGSSMMISQCVLALRVFLLHHAILLLGAPESVVNAL